MRTCHSAPIVPIAIAHREEGDQQLARPGMRQRIVPPVVPYCHGAWGGRAQGRVLVALMSCLGFFKLVLFFFRSALIQYVCILYFIFIHTHPVHGMYRELRQADIRYFGYHSVPIVSYIQAATSQEPMYIHSSMTSNTCVKHAWTCLRGGECGQCAYLPPRF